MYVWWGQRPHVTVACGGQRLTCRTLLLLPLWFRGQTGHHMWPEPPCQPKPQYFLNKNNHRIEFKILFCLTQSLSGSFRDKNLIYQATSSCSLAFQIHTASQTPAGEGVRLSAFGVTWAGGKKGSIYVSTWPEASNTKDIDKDRYPQLSSNEEAGV